MHMYLPFSEIITRTIPIEKTGTVLMNNVLRNLAVNIISKYHVKILRVIICMIYSDNSDQIYS